MIVKCDYDYELPYDIGARIQFVCRAFFLNPKSWQFYRTRRGWHMEIHFRNRREPLEIVLIQTLLGSDWKREAFNGARARTLSQRPAMWRHSNRWNVLYKSHTRRITLYGTETTRALLAASGRSVSRSKRRQREVGGGDSRHAGIRRR